MAGKKSSKKHLTHDEEEKLLHKMCEEASKRPEKVTNASPGINAPMAGVFYRIPAPGKELFAKVGDIVEPGQKIGLVEAMKLFTEVVWNGVRPAKILKFKAQNEECVDADQLLVIVDPDP